MKVIPINNNYRYNLQIYKTNPVQNIAFNGLFSKSLQDKFNDGIAALDGNSVFIFAPEAEKERAKYQFNEAANKIDIPIFKTYSYFPDKNELPKYDSGSVSFGIYKKGEDYYIISLNDLFSMYVGNNLDDFDKTSMNALEIRMLGNHDKIRIHDELFDESKSVIFEFKPPKSYNPREAEKYMEVRNRFSANSDLAKFNRAAASMLTKSKNVSGSKERKFTFEDVGGLEKQKEELRKYVLRPLAYPDVYKNIRLNKGILLYGPPRCGKTLIGKALANEADVKYEYINANEWISGTVGSSESNIRTAFSRIMSNPTILFIDEFDAIGKKRDGSANARYQDPVVNQLLGCMSDLEKSYMNSFVIAATNRKDLLDEALLASGRLGLHLEVPMPDEKALGSIYDIHSKNQSFDNDVSKPEIVKLMLENKFNGSDVAEMITVGYLNALERLGMNQKMDAKIFRFDDLQRIKVSAMDLKNAISKINAQKMIIK